MDESWNEFEAELLASLRRADRVAASRTAGHGGARVRLGETTVLLGMDEEGSFGEMLALRTVVGAHYERLLKDARGRRVAEFGHGVWRELIAPDKAIPVQSFLQWRDLPDAHGAAETTIVNNGQQVITRLMSIASVRADSVPEWFDISDLMKIR